MILCRRMRPMEFLHRQVDNGWSAFCYSVDSKNDSLSSRIEKLPIGESVASAFQSWMGDGFPVRRSNIFHTVNRLRKLNMNRRGLEVMEWIIREKPYRLNELDYSFLLEFTSKFHGIEQGERLFSHIPPEFCNELLYNNLAIACLDKGILSLSLAYMKKMRELGHSISYQVYNRLIIQHSSPKRRNNIPKILTLMRAGKVLPHVSTFNILMKIQAGQHNIEGLFKVYNDMKRENIQPDEISYCILATEHAIAKLYTSCETYVEHIEKSFSGNNWSSLEILTMLYGYLGKLKDLERTWGRIKELPHVRDRSYMLAIEAFGRLGEVLRIEEIFSEMVAEKESYKTEQFNSLISVYCKHGLVSKASKLFREMKVRGCMPNGITYRHLALGCLRSGLIKEALKTLEMGFKLKTSLRVRKSRPWLETTLSIVEEFAENGDVENAEKMFEELREAKYSRYTFVFNTLIKAYLKAKSYHPSLLRRMILGGGRPDSETYSLLKLIEQFKVS